MKARYTQEAFVVIRDFGNVASRYFPDDKKAVKTVMTKRKRGRLE